MSELRGTSDTVDNQFANDEARMTNVEGNPPRASNRWKQLGICLAVIVGVWLVAAYVLLPLAWRGYAKRHPAIEDSPTITHTANGVPGDPLNVALVGTVDELHLSMLAAKWHPADPVTLESSLRIAGDVVLRRPYDDAPISPLYLFNRKQDFAFEKPVGDNPKQRHHVRFWREEKVDDQGRPLWIGSVTFDERVGLSHTTAQITHHIGPDLDAERDGLLADLKNAGQLESEYYVDGFQPNLTGKNGGGDPYHDDGRLGVGVLKDAKQP